MTTGRETSRGLPGNANIGEYINHTSDHPVIDAAQNYEDLAKVESSELTSGEMERQPPTSVERSPERDLLVAKFRAAQASALFDPEAMALLESFTKNKSISFAELAEIVAGPAMWIKLAILVRAYLVEPLDNGVRVTPEGLQALEKVRIYLSRLDVKTKE